MPLNVYFLADISASMYGAPFHAVCDALDIITSTLTQMLEKHVYLFSLMAFESNPHIVARHNAHLSSETLDTLTTGGTSCLAKAWRVVEGWLEEDGSPTLCFVLTDGDITDGLPDSPLLSKKASYQVNVGCGREARLDRLTHAFHSSLLWHETGRNELTRMLEAIVQRILDPLAR